MFEPHRFRPERMNIPNFHNYSWRGFYSDVFILRGYDAAGQLRRNVSLFRSDRETAGPSPLHGVLRFLKNASSVILLNSGVDDRAMSQAVERQSANLTGPAPHIAARHRDQRIRRYQTGLRCRDRHTTITRGERNLLAGVGCHHGGSRFAPGNRAAHAGRTPRHSPHLGASSQSMPASRSSSIMNRTCVLPLP